MFNLIRKAHAFLRNTSVHSDDLDDIFGDNDPWYTRVYWSLWRFGNRIWHSPRDSYYAIKYFIQRGRRGWADCDNWSLDYYLSGWLPAALRHLKDHKHGIPSAMFITEDCGEDGNITDEAMKVREVEWDAIMDRMIAGFEADARIKNALYEKELGPYPGRRPKNRTKEEWEKFIDDRYAAGRKLEERDELLFQDGMALFAKYYRSLWD